jgi:Nucleotidyl transferase AbiEii toxin, Type IV TA system
MKFKEVLSSLITRFNKANVDFVLCGGLALATMNIFRFTKDIDFLIFDESKERVHKIMLDLDYQLQDFSNDEIKFYFSPLKAFGQVDFILAKRKYTRAMMRRASIKPIFKGKFNVKVLQIEDLIGLKIQAIFNDPENRYLVDAPDIKQLLALHSEKIDMTLVREYFRVFDREELLDEWLDDIERKGKMGDEG